MFTNYLEVKENLKMSQKLSGQDGGGEIKDTLKLVGPHKWKGVVHVLLKLPLTRQENDQPDIEADGSAVLFSEGCSLLSTKSVNDDFKRDFSIPMYDEYEEEHLEVIPKEPAIEPRSSNGENQAAIQSQKVEIGKDNKCA